MRVEVPVQQTEVWEIDENLCGGLLRFWNRSKDGYYLYGKDHWKMPGVPERVQEQVRKKWEELRPLEDDEIQFKDGRKVKLLRANVTQDGAHAPYDRPCVLHGTAENLAAIAMGFFDNQLSDEFAPGTAERLQKYWLKNYHWRADECLRWDGKRWGGKTAHRISHMGSNEVRFPTGVAYTLYAGDEFPIGLDEQQTSRATEIFKRLQEEKEKAAAEENPNIVDGYEFRLGEFGVECRKLNFLSWVYVNPCSRKPQRLAAANKWMKQRKVIIAFEEELKNQGIEE